MGVRNLRAICPNCGGKIATQPKGLGNLSLWMNSWFLVKTGTQCQWCGVKLTGKVGPDNQAELADPPSPAAPAKNQAPVSGRPPSTGRFKRG